MGKDDLENGDTIKPAFLSEIEIADNLGISGVPRELHNKTLLVRKVC